MKTFRKDLKQRFKNKAFKKAYDTEHNKIEEKKLLIEFGLILKKNRTLQNMTQKKLAEKAVVTQQQLSNIESGANATIQTYLRVCDALNIPLHIGKSPQKRLAA